MLQASILSQRLDTDRRVQRVAYVLTDGPETEPLTVDECKAHLKRQDSAEDDLIERMAKAARAYIERAWGLALITQSYTATFDQWPRDGIMLRPHKVANLDHVKVWDGAALTATDLANYQLINTRPAYVVVTDGGALPLPSRSRAGIEVGFTCGFGDEARDVPDEIKQAMLMLVGHWYPNRSAVISAKTGFGISNEIALGVDALMSPYRSRRLR